LFNPDDCLTRTIVLLDCLTQTIVEPGQLFTRIV